LIRLATPMDLEAVLDLLEAMRMDTFWRDVAFRPNREAVGLWLLTTLSQDAQYRLLVAEEEARIVGFCMGQVAVNPFVPDVPYVYEVAFYVRPAYRGHRLAHALWERMTAWGRGVGAKAVAYSRPVHHRGAVVEELVWRTVA
jgi:GNAT superfamily N-acetyltransferase